MGPRGVAIANQEVPCHHPRRTWSPPPLTEMKCMCGDSIQNLYYFHIYFLNLIFFCLIYYFYYNYRNSQLPPPHLTGIRDRVLRSMTYVSEYDRAFRRNSMQLPEITRHQEDHESGGALFL